MVRVVPVDLAQAQVGPVHDAPFGEPERAVARLDQLEQRLDTIEEAGRGIGRDGDGCGGEVDPVGLCGEGLFVGVQGLADGDGSGREQQGDGTAALRLAKGSDMKARAEAFLEAGDGDVIGPNAFTLEAPGRAATKISRVQRDLLRLGKHRIAASA